MDSGSVHDVPYFDRFAPLYDLLLPETDAAPLEAGLSRSDRPVECVLDLGGGTGRAARVLSDATVVLDGSNPMLIEARSRGLRTVQGDVRHLPLRDESVDGVVSVDAVHHFPAVATVIEEAGRVLRPGGALVIREFDPTTIRGRVLVLGERVVGFESTFFPPGEIQTMMHRAGLDATIEETGFVYTVVGVKRTAEGDGTDE